MKTLKTILSIFFVLMLFFAGCSSPPANEQTTATTNAQGASETTQAGVVTTTGAQATATTVASGGAAMNELLGLIGGAATDYMVVYNVKTTGTESSTDTDMTYYVKGDSKLRMDSAYKVDGKTIDSRTFLLNKEVISCSLATGVWSCMKFSNSNQKDTAEAKKEMENNIKDSTVTRIADRVVAGINTKCYKLLMGAEALGNTEAVYCVSGDGVTLYSELKTGGETLVMEAKSYRKGTSDSDYVLPAEPKDMSAMIGGTGSQGVSSEEEIQKLLDEAQAAAEE